MYFAEEPPRTDHEFTFDTPPSTPETKPNMVEAWILENIISIIAAIERATIKPQETIKLLRDQKFTPANSWQEEAINFLIEKTLQILKETNTDNSHKTERLDTLVRAVRRISSEQELQELAQKNSV